MLSTTLDLKHQLFSSVHSLAAEGVGLDTAGGHTHSQAELVARRRQRAEAFLRRSAALLQCALGLGTASDQNRTELQALYTAALGDLDAAEATCGDLDIVRPCRVHECMRQQRFC